jgi:hypothetical protein
MLSQKASLAIVVVIAGVGGYALLRNDGSPTPTAAVPISNMAPLRAPTMAGATSLPPGHPAIGATSRDGMGSASAAMPLASDDPATLRWTVPATWTVLPNPSAMRLATYGVPHAAGDRDDTEVSVSRAGGTADANIERWLGQFDDRGKDTRVESTRKGLTITVVDVTGTFLGGGMTPGAAPASHPGWSLLAAIVEGSGTPYFVKITGPAATVRSARPDLDALLASLAPT